MKKIKQVTSQIIVFINCILLCFVCFTPPKKVYADAGVGTISQGKNVLLTILGYMGVELVGTAQVIDSYVQEAWQLFLSGLSAPFTQEAYTLTAIAGMVQWDDVNNVLTIPKDLYNLVSQWAMDLKNTYNITSNTEELNIAEIEVPQTAFNLNSIADTSATGATAKTYGNSAQQSDNYTWYFVGLNNVTANYAYYKDSSHDYYHTVFVISSEEYSRLNELSNTRWLMYVQQWDWHSGSTGFNPENYSTIGNFTRFNDAYYSAYNSIITLGENYVGDIPVYNTITEAVNSIVSGSGSLTDNVYVNGNLNLDDRIISTDNGGQLVLDPAVPAGQTYTLDQVLDAVLDWAISNTWPTDLTITDAIPIAIPEAIDTVIIPTAPYVEVPQLLLPSNLPIIFSPECEDFSACLVNGISAVSSDITNFYNSNEYIRNYANIILYIGVSFVALGVIRRHL